MYTSQSNVLVTVNVYRPFLLSRDFITSLRWIVLIVSNLGTLDEILVLFKLITNPLIQIHSDRCLEEGKNVIA